MRNVLYVVLTAFANIAMMTTTVLYTDSWWSIAALLLASAACGVVNYTTRMPFRRNMAVQTLLNSSVYAVVFMPFYGIEAAFVVGGLNVITQGAMHLIEGPLLSAEAKQVRNALLEATAKHAL